jgi:hypothetical protein
MIWKKEDIRAKIEQEGLDYFLLEYVSIEELPQDLQDAAKAYLKAAQDFYNVLGADY